MLSNYLVRILTVTITILITFVPLNVAQAITIAYDNVKIGPLNYHLGDMNGQKPIINGFTGVWHESKELGNYQIVEGGLSVPANGTVGAVGNYAHNKGHIAGVGDGSVIFLPFNTDLQNVYETNYWIRYIIKPTTKVSYLNQLTSSANLSLGGTASTYGLYSADLQTVSGGPSPLKVNENNLIVLHISADRSAGQPETLKLWLNPSSYSDLQAGINAHQVAIGNILEGEDKFITGSLDWGESRTQGDELWIGTSLKDVITPAS